MQSAVKSATLVGALLWAAANTVVQAAPATPFGVINGQQVLIGEVADGSFLDFYNFQVGSNNGVIFSINSFGSNSAGIGATTISVYEGYFSENDAVLPTSLITRTGTSNPSPTPDAHLTTASLGPLSTSGFYTLTVGGTSGGEAVYAGFITLAPVPEPETYAMLLAGMGIMGFMAQRRRKHR